MKVPVLLLVPVLAACARAPADSPPGPGAAEAVRQAREELDLVPAESPDGMCTLFWRTDVGDPKTASDIGDFVGRLQTLFGPTPDHVYTLRDKLTGIVVTATAVEDGPAYRGHKDGDDAAHWARIAADPMLANGPPKDPHALDQYQLHVEIAAAGPDRSAIVKRLEALVESVPPADWDMTDYFHSLGGVFHVGAKHGTSFATPVPPAQAIAFLLGRADKAGPATQADMDAVEFFLGHQAELTQARPRVVALVQRFESAANAAPADRKKGMLDVLTGWKWALHL